jgi:hypothetical protein
MLTEENDSDDGLLDELLIEAEHDDELQVQDVLKTLKEVELKFENDIKRLKTRYSAEIERLRVSLLGVSIKSAEASRKRILEDEHPQVVKKQAKKVKKQVSTFSHTTQKGLFRTASGLPRNHSEPYVAPQPNHPSETLAARLKAADGPSNHGYLQRAAKVEYEEAAGDSQHEQSGFRLREALPDTTHISSHSFLRLHKLIAEQVHDGELSVENWWTAGVLVTKSEPKTTKNGSHFMTIVLGDLKGNLVNVLLFDKAYEAFWKQLVTAQVVGIVTPKIPPRIDANKARMSLSISTASQLIILGKSVDYVVCRAISNEGKQCVTALDRYFLPQK